MKVRKLIEHCSIWGDDRPILLYVQDTGKIVTTCGKAIEYFGNIKVKSFTPNSISLPKCTFMMKVLLDCMTDWTVQDFIYIIRNGLSPLKLTLQDAYECFGEYEVIRFDNETVTLED